MSFSDTYGHAVLETRRIRAQRARFWAKIVSFALMITVGVTLHTEPELRQGLMNAAMQGGMTLTGRESAALAPLPSFASDSDRAAVEKLLRQAEQNAQETPGRIKVNRPSADSEGAINFERAGAAEAPATPNTTVDATDTASRIGAVLERLKPGQ